MYKDAPGHLEQEEVPGILREVASPTSDEDGKPDEGHVQEEQALRLLG